MGNCNHLIPVYRRRLLEERGSRCLVCGGIFDLQFAHIRPTPLSNTRRGRGRKERIYDVKRNPFDYALLCGGDHDLLDRDSIEFISCLSPEILGRFMDLFDRRNYRLEPLVANDANNANNVNGG